MEVLRDLASCPRAPEGTVVTIGFYDGVHVGHRLVIDEVRRLAAERGARTAVVTFDRHPATIVRPESAPLLLTDLDQRLELLAGTGVDYTLALAFDEDRAAESAEEFVTEVLVDCLQARAVVVGEDFHFGHRRRGDVALLREMGRAAGFEVDGVKLMASGAAGARPVSSTAIREALAGGDIASANRMLGRPHEVRGAHAGRGEVSVPAGICVPGLGTYAGWCLTAAEAPPAPAPAVVTVLARSGSHDDGAGPSRLDVRLLDGAGSGSAGATASVRFAARVAVDDPDAVRAALQG